MNILMPNAEWVGGFPDYYRAEDAYRIEVRAWCVLEPISDQYFAPARRLRAVATYLREVSPLDIWRKFRSRASEASRNQKFLSIGAGRIVERPNDEGALPLGALVGFVAPSHPLCAQRIVAPRALVTEVLPADVVKFVSSAPSELLLLREFESSPEEYSSLRNLGGWIPASTPNGLGSDGRMSIAAELAAALGRADWRRAELMDITETEIQERLHNPEAQPRPETRNKTLRGAVIGYGHYTKTTLLPNLSPGIRVGLIHEIDPLQAPRAHPMRGGDSESIVVDSAPHIRDDELDVVFIASYHSTHAPLATEALRRNCAAVAEKPIATTTKQLEDLVDAAIVSDAPYYAAFQRRYSKFNEFARTDLGTALGDPISYHALVYEVPLPLRHWYRWPSQGGRLVANGCHWIDHFLFLNDYSPPIRSWAHTVSSTCLACGLELANGAAFTMALTDQGSPRLGVRDHVELRAEGRTVTIVNNCRYSAEDSDRTIRKSRQHRGASYRAMYTTISEALVKGAGLDTPDHTRISGEAVLQLANLAHTDRGRAAI